MKLLFCIFRADINRSMRVFVCVIVLVDYLSHIWIWLSHSVRIHPVWFHGSHKRTPTNVNCSSEWSVDDDIDYTYFETLVPQEIIITSSSPIIVWHGHELLFNAEKIHQNKCPGRPHSDPFQKVMQTKTGDWASLVENMSKYT